MIFPKHCSHELLVLR